MPGQPDHPDVVAEVLAAELRADAELPGHLQHLLLQVHVPDGVAERRALDGQRVQVAGRGQLGDLEVELRRRATDHDRQVVRGTGRRAEAAQLLVQEAGQPRRVEQGLRLLVQERLVGAAAALGHEEELVARVGTRRVVQLDLRRQVRAGVALLPEVQRRHLRVPQVELLVGVEDALGERGLVGAAGEHVLGALADHDRGAGVLAHRQHATGRHARVAQQVRRDEPVVRTGLGVIDDRPQLRQVTGPQQVLDVPDRLVRQPGERGGLDREELATRGVRHADAVRGHQPVLGVVVRAEREHIRVLERGDHFGGGHGG